MKKTLIFSHKNNEYILEYNGESLVQIDDTKLSLSTLQLYTNLFKNLRENVEYDVVFDLNTKDTQILSKGKFIFEQLKKLINDCEKDINEIVNNIK